MVQANQEENFCDRILREVQESQARWAAEKAQREEESHQQNAVVASLAAQSEAVIQRVDTLKSKISNAVDAAAVRAGMQMARYSPYHMQAMWAMESEENKNIARKLNKAMRPEPKQEQ